LKNGKSLPLFPDSVTSKTKTRRPYKKFELPRKNDQVKKKKSLAYEFIEPGF
jgi:hypothetical protein